MEETLRYLGIVTEFEQLADDVRTMQQRMAEIRETADSADGLVSATVGGTGNLIELWLDPRVYRDTDSTALAQTITDTIHRAVGQAHKQGFAAAADLLPAGATLESTDLTFDPLLRELDRSRDRR